MAKAYKPIQKPVRVVWSHVRSACVTAGNVVFENVVVFFNELWYVVRENKAVWAGLGSEE